jgi:hypothetical protein
MDNKDLANFIKLELSKVTNAINNLIPKLSAPGKQDQASITPQQAPSNKSHSAPGEPLLVPPTPANTSNTKKSTDKPNPRRTLGRTIWRQTKRIFFKKDRLERIGLIAGIIYALVTALQWQDLRHNFMVTERAYVRVGRVESTYNNEGDTTVKLFLENSGHVPSVGLKGEVNSAVGMGKLSKFYFGGDLTKIFPGSSSYFFPFGIYNLTEERMKSLPGPFGIWVTGEITYGDGFGHSVHEPFCFNFQMRLATWMACEIGSSPDRYVEEYRKKNMFKYEVDTSPKR